MLSKHIFPLVLSLSVCIVKAAEGDVWFYKGEQCAGPWVEPGQSYYDDTNYYGPAFGSVWIEGIYEGPTWAAAGSKGCLNLYTEPNGGGDHAKWRFTLMDQCANVPKPQEGKKWQSYSWSNKPCGRGGSEFESDCFVPLVTGASGKKELGNNGSCKEL